MTRGQGGVSRYAKGGWKGSVGFGGKRYYVYAKTKTATQKLLAQKREDLRQHPPTPLPSPLPARGLASVCAQWLAHKNLREGTRDEYARLLAYACAYFGDARDVATITPQDLAAYRASLARSKAPQTVRNFLLPLVAATGCSYHVPAATAQREPLVLDTEQARRLIQACHGHRLEGLFLLALTAGLREGEILGLCWQDVDLERGALTVRQAYRAGRERRYGLGKPKTKAGKRVIPLVPFVRDYLAALPHGAPADPVLVGKDGEHLRSSNYARSLKQVCAKADLPLLTVHELRHSAATILLEHGVPAHQVSALLGHASVHVTLGIYAHLTHRMEANAVAALRSAFVPPHSSPHNLSPIGASAG